MRTINLSVLYLFMLSFLGFGLSSCDDNGKDEPTGSGTITLSEKEFGAPGKGGQIVITVTANPATLDWEAVPDKSWVSITDKTATTFVISIPEWEDYGDEVRTATVTVSAPGVTKSAEVAITQYPQEWVVEFEVQDTDDIEFEVRGGEEFVKVSSNVVWNATTDANWINIIKATDGSGFTVRTGANETAKLLEDVITVAVSEGIEGATPVKIKVTQDFIPPYIILRDQSGNEIESREFSFNYESFLGMPLAEVYTNIRYETTYETNADAEGNDEWFMAFDPYNEGYVYIQFSSENATGQNRSATVTITPTDEEMVMDPVVFTVTQRFLVEVDGPEFAGGNEIIIDATPDGPVYLMDMTGYPITLVEPEALDWLVATADNIMGNISIDAIDNGSTEPRTGIIHAFIYPTEDSRGMTPITVIQEGLAVAPEFGSTYESLFGTYTVTGTDTEGESYTGTTTLQKGTAYPFNDPNENNQAYTTGSPFYTFVSPYTGKSFNPATYIERTKEGEIYFHNRTNFNTFWMSGETVVNSHMAWIVYDARGWIAPQEGVDHIQNYVNLTQELAIIQSANIDPVAKTISFPARTYQWEADHGESLQPYNGMTMYYAGGYSGGFGIPFAPYKGLKDIVFTLVE